MSKIKKMILGIVLAMCVFGGSMNSCYAMTSGISAGITATSAWGDFRYEEAGHHLKVTVFFEEKDSLGQTKRNEVSAHQFGNFTSVYVSRFSPEGWQYTGGYAGGYVDDVMKAVTTWEDVK